MAIRSASVVWRGSLVGGNGDYRTESGAAEGRFAFGSRFEDEPGSNPEELIAAAHAGCFSMALSHGLSEAGHEPDEVRTTAKVHLDKVDGGFAITRVDLECRAAVPGIDEETFRTHADEAKAGCPVSKVLTGAEIHLDAALSG